VVYTVDNQHTVDLQPLHSVTLAPRLLLQLCLLMSCAIMDGRNGWPGMGPQSILEVIKKSGAYTPAQVRGARLEPNHWPASRLVALKLGLCEGTRTQTWRF